MKAVSLAVLLVFIQVAVSGPLRSVIAEQKVVNYLTRFGYLEKGKVQNIEHVQDALKKLQNFFRLPVTGIADKATLELMSKPRCGVPDIVNTNNTRFVIGTEGFDKKHITYFIENYSPKLPKDEVDQSVKLALDIWKVHAYLTVSQLDGKDADILLSFTPQYHNDNYPFDGPDGTLAHAFYPTFPGFAGDVHFDEVENWNVVTETSPDGYDFFSVAIHELGHSLGLAHSNVESAVMFPTYQYIDKNRGLDADDMQGIYAIYGAKP